MPYTRRAFLRDASLLSLAGHAAHETLYAQTTAPPKGICIFFSGAWVFSQNYLSQGGSTDASLLATTLDCGNMHSFPFGAWGKNDTIKWVDHRTELPPNSADSSSIMPYTVSVASNPSYKTATELFKHTCSTYNFTLIKRWQKNVSLQLGDKTLRTIALPLPTKIIPAGFRQSTQISDTGSRLYPRNTKNDKGVATTHIFWYENADQLTFSWKENGIGKSDTILAKDGSHYHFHTISKSDDEHGQQMFGALLGLAKSTGDDISDLNFQAANPSTEKVTYGADVDVYAFGDDELGIVKSLSPVPQPAPPAAKGKKAPYMIRLATCGSGGLGLIDNCTPDATTC